MKSVLKTFLASAAAVTISLYSYSNAQEADSVSEDTLTFEEALQDTANWREVAPENMIVFDILTSEGAERGRVIIETADFAAPRHVEQFKAIVKSGDYAGTVFHRVIDDFMAQGGDVKRAKPASNWPTIDREFVFARKPLDPEDTVPKSQLLGQAQSATSGYINGFPIKTQSEFLAGLTEGGSIESWIVHCAGTVSTARTNDPNSASTQFFLMRGTSPHLDKTYTAWGRVIGGQDVVMAIKQGEPVSRPDILISADLASDMAEDERPRALVQRTDGPAFAGFLAANAGVDVCDLPQVPSLISE